MIIVLNYFQNYSFTFDLTSRNDQQQINKLDNLLAQLIDRNILHQFFNNNFYLIQFDITSTITTSQFMISNQLPYPYEQFPPNLDNNSYENAINITNSHTQIDDESRFECQDNKPNKSIDSREQPTYLLQTDQKPDFKPRQIKVRSQCSSLKEKINSSYKAKKDLIFLFFGDKKVEMHRQNTEYFFTKKFGEQFSLANIQDLKCQDIIQQIVCKMCIQELQFQPMHVKKQTFNLVVYVGQQKQELILNSLPFSMLFHYDIINVIRVPRSLKLSDSYKEATEKKKDVLQVIEILSPDQRDLVQIMDKNKTVGDLKEKISLYYYQIIGKIVMLTYSNLKLVDNRKKISELPQKIIQIYQQKVDDYTDKTFVKRSENTYTFNDFNCLVKHQQDDVPSKLQEIDINQSFIYGKLYLKIQQNKLIQRYSGGIVGYLRNDSIKSRSLLTLIGIKIVQTNLFLQFMFKGCTEVVQYSFLKESVMNDVIKNILVICRLYSHNLDIIE